MNPTLRNWLIILVVGAAIWFSPIPTGLKPDAWHIFAVFVATVLGFILHPMPIGAIAFISLTFCCFTGLLKTSQVLMGFGNGTIWLIVCAFFLSRAFIKTGFGRRIAYVIIKLIGRSSLTLGYSIALSELVVSPAMPSATALSDRSFAFRSFRIAARSEFAQNRRLSDAGRLSHRCHDLHDVPHFNGRQPALCGAGRFRRRRGNYVD